MEPFDVEPYMQYEELCPYCSKFNPQTLEDIEKYEALIKESGE